MKPHYASSILFMRLEMKGNIMAWWEWDGLNASQTKGLSVLQSAWIKIHDRVDWWLKILPKCECNGQMIYPGCNRLPLPYSIRSGYTILLHHRLQSRHDDGWILKTGAALNHDELGCFCQVLTFKQWDFKVNASWHGKSLVASSKSKLSLWEEKHVCMLRVHATYYIVLV